MRAREEQAIPEIVFSRIVPSRGRPASLQRHRKPLWVDTRNPMCLDLLRHALDTVDDADWIVLTEVLPYGAQPGSGSSERVSELLIELLV